MSGYSTTPLNKKLGLKPGYRVLVVNQPEHYVELIAPLPAGVQLLQRRGGSVDMVHFFSHSRRELQRRLPNYIPLVHPAGMIWVSWPKKASKIPTDMSEDVIREVALPLGLVDVKVCAVDETWSGLKLVVRRENR